MDKILAEYADQAYETARLRRNGVLTTRDLVSAEMLAELEAAGEAMRYVNSTRSNCVEGDVTACSIILWTLSSTRRPTLRTSNDAHPCTERHPIFNRGDEGPISSDCKMNGKWFKQP